MGGHSRQRVLECGDAEFEVLAREVLKKGLAFRFRAKGCSMRPLVCAGDALYVKAVTADEIRVGDILLLNRGGGKLLAHRVVRRSGAGAESQFLVKGDRLRDADGYVPAHDVLGRVVARERDGKVVQLTYWPWSFWGRIAAWLSPTWYPVLCLLPRFRFFMSVLNEPAVRQMDGG